MACRKALAPSPIEQNLGAGFRLFFSAPSKNLPAPGLSRRAFRDYEGPKPAGTPRGNANEMDLIAATAAMRI
jgi:hypothetical protein